MTSPPCTAKPSAISKEATRAHNEQLILAAAEPIFARHGYRGASVQAIAEAAGLPKSNVLYYMGSKQALYVRLLARMMQGFSSNGPSAA